MEPWVHSLECSAPNVSIENQRNLFYDENAWMKGVFKDMKGDPMASAVTVTSMSGEIVSSGIIVGSPQFATAGDKREKKAAPSTKPYLPKLSSADTPEAKKILEWMKNNNPMETPVLFPPKPESIEAAEDWNMVAIGVNSSAYFSTEAFLRCLESVCRNKRSSCHDPIVMIGDGARIHATIAG